MKNGKHKGSDKVKYELIALIKEHSINTTFNDEKEYKDENSDDSDDSDDSEEDDVPPPINDRFILNLSDETLKESILRMSDIVDRNYNNYTDKIVDKAVSIYGESVSRRKSEYILDQLYKKNKNIYNTNCYKIE